MLKEQKNQYLFSQEVEVFLFVAKNSKHLILSQLMLIPIKDIKNGW